MNVTKVLAASMLATLVLLSGAMVQAQKASSTIAPVPVHKRAVITPKLGNAATATLDVQRRMRDFEQFMELVLADARDVARGLREEHIGAAPAIGDVGKPAGRDTGRAADRVGSRTGDQGSPYGSEYENPLGSTMSGIDSRIRGNKPRSTVVGATQPGAGGIASTGIGKSPTYNTTRPWSSSGAHGVNVHGTTTTTHDSRTRATVKVDVVAYSDSNGALLSWSESTTDNMGKSTTTSHVVDYVGASGDTPVVTTTTQVLNAENEVLSDSEPTARPYDPDRDPPLDGTQVAEGGGATGFDGPLGISCNPITGVCGPGLKLGSAQVNPGRMDQAMIGTRLRIDPRNSVINPDPDALENVGTPDPINRDGKGPGAKPPKPH